MKIEPFKPEHLLAPGLLESQPHVRAALQSPEYMAALAAHPAWTAFDGDRFVGAAGVITLWQGRVQAWAVLAGDIGQHQFIAVHRAVLRFLSTQRGRIESVVAVGFEPGHRWMRMLGFQLETPHPMRGWLPNGADALQYARYSK